MINRLTGYVVEKNPPFLVLEVNGVGYELLAPMSTFYAISEEKEKITLLTQFIVREDAQLLYGFATAQEKTLFQVVIKINGVGPKLALAILSSMSVNEFITCISEQNLARLVKIPGVGKKTAERILVEMRHKLADWNGVANSYSLETLESSLPLSQGNQSEQDAISALISLGYKPQEAMRLVQALPDKTQDSQTLIRQALRAVSA